MSDFLRFPTWPPQWPEIADSIAATTRSGDWGRYRGPATAAVTDRIAQLCQTQHCRLVSSGSLGIELGLRAVGVGPGDQVALCGYDYPGNFRAIEWLGARPVLVDADAGGFSIDPAELGRASDLPIKAVVVSHLYGIPAAMSQIEGICRERGWKLVEDACQSPGMLIDGRPAGNWGDVAVLSFGGSKPLTAGNGGAVVTNQDRVASKLAAWLDRPSQAAPFSELQAASLLPQLDRLAECNRVRWESTREILDSVAWMEKSVGPRRPSPAATLYKLAFLVPDRDAWIPPLTARGMPIGVGYRSMHRSSDRRCGKIGSLDHCRLLGERLCVLDHSALLATGSQRKHLIEALSQADPPPG